MIRGVIFDFGNVLKWNVEAEIRQNIAKAFGVSLDELANHYEPAIPPLQKGIISEEEFWHQLAEKLGKLLPVGYSRLFSGVYEEKFIVNTPMLTLAERIRKGGYMTAILSNTIPSHAHSTKALVIKRGFQPVLLSFEAGMRKPERGFYQLCLERMGLRPAEAAFIDDEADYVAAASALGIHSHQYRVKDRARDEQVLNFLRELGIRI